MRFALIVDVVATLSTACADEARSRRPDDGALLPVSGALVGPLRPSPKRSREPSSVVTTETSTFR